MPSSDPPPPPPPPPSPGDDKVAKARAVAKRFTGHALALLTQAATWVREKAIPAACQIARTARTKLGPAAVRFSTWMRGTLVPGLRDVAKAASRKGMAAVGWVVAQLHRKHSSLRKRAAQEEGSTAPPPDGVNPDEVAPLANLPATSEPTEAIAPEDPAAPFNESLPEPELQPELFEGPIPPPGVPADSPAADPAPPEPEPEPEPAPAYREVAVPPPPPPPPPSSPPPPPPPLASPPARRSRNKRKKRPANPLFQRLRNLGVTRWALPLVLLVLAVLIGLTLLGRMKRDVWAYYTDDAGTRVEVQEEKTRYVLWEDPQPTTFAPEKAPEKAAPSTANSPTGRLEAAFSPNETQMVVVRWNEVGGNADMFLSEWNGRVWSLPVPIAGINTNSNERGPAFSHDGRYLYFSSDRPGGAGGYDLYVARWDGKNWTGIESLGSTVNTAGDEAGPAVSPDDTRLFFSSNREGTKADDIFVAVNRAKAEKPKEEAIPPVPRFDSAEIVSHLNSKAHDVQAALSARGDHVFLASDRDRNRDTGYGVYFSRVVEGVALPPERVNLYIEKGDVTDPAVRMEGFDLVFSANHEASSRQDEEGYRLYRSTTREVIGYTDLSRWEQFKELLSNIKWWILLAVAALLALIYLLEKWQDISSLFHKCLAGSAVAHLLLLLAAMIWLIALEIESEEPPPPTEISISVDALTEEELAMESAPEETEITQPDMALESQKAESKFDVPEMEPQENEDAFPIDSAVAKEAMTIEVKPTDAEPTEEAPAEPSEPSKLFSELSDTQLPEPEPPTLEERVVQEDVAPAKPADDQFKPQDSLPVAERSQTQPLNDNAVEDPAEAAEIEPSESVADNPAPAPMTEVRPEQAEQSASTQPETAEPLDSQLLSSLPQEAPVNPENLLLEENSGKPAEAPADASKDMFAPGDSVPNTATTKAESGPVGGAAAESTAEAAEVAGSAVAATPIDSSPSGAVSEANTESDVPESSLDAAPAIELPSTPMVDAGNPQLDEGAPAPDSAPANPAEDLFTPNGAVSEPATTQLEGAPVADAAVPNQADAAEVATGELAPTPATEGPAGPVSEAQTSETVADVAITPVDIGGLPETALLDTGAPQLDEGDPQADPADASKDQFTPGGAPQTASNPLEATANSGSAETTPAEAAEVGSGELTSTPADANPASAVGEARTEADLPEVALNPGDIGGAPEQSLLDGAPQLDEGDPQADPADASKDQFKPGGAAQTASNQAEAAANSGSAETTPADAAEVGSGELASTPANADPSSAVGEAKSEADLPEVALNPGDIGGAPDQSLLDGAPQLDEGNPDGGPADPSKDMFKPGGAPQTASTQVEGSAKAGDAAADPAEATEVGEGKLAAAPADNSPSEAVGEAQSEATLPEVALNPGDIGGAPDQSLLEGAPQLEEGNPDGGPADPSKDLFQPGGSGVAATKAQSDAQSGEAADSQPDSNAVAGGGPTRDTANEASPQTGLEAADTQATGAAPLTPAALGPVATVSLLPDSLEAPRLDGRAMTDALKKQGGRPSLDTIKQLGGSDGTEKAIRASIRWLSKNQEDDGSWDARLHGAKGEFDTGVTGLAMLCFYGWGARHDRDGEYREHVSKAVDYLLAQQKKNGDLSGDGLMYCHAIASIALCEAYSVTKDPKLREPAERAIGYSLRAQSKTKGGWRYNPGDDSDTSITGWQYMALHSARMAGITVPDKNFELVRGWLDRVGGGKHGGIYGYQAPARNSPAMVATGMFCRQLDLIRPSDPKMMESAAMLKQNPMKSRNLDQYYIYYATLALYQHQGPVWESWNERLKEILPLTQIKSGSREGSWAPSRGLAGNGGRVASTALATLSLEVYYRLLPMYGFRGEEAPEVKKKSEAPNP